MPRTKADTRGSGLDISKASLALPEVQNNRQTPNLPGPTGVTAQKPVSEVSRPVIEKLQKEADFFVSRAAVNKATSEIDNIMSSKESNDPDSPGKIGLLLRKGENSFGSVREFTNRMSDLKFKTKEGLSREQRLMFDKKFDSIRAGKLNQLQQHNRYQYNSYKKDTYANDLKWTISTIAEHASSPSDVRLGMQDLETVIREYHDTNNYFGSSRETFSQIMRQHLEEAATIVIEKNLLEVPTPSGIDSLEGLDQALNSYKILEENFLGDTYGGGLNVYIPRKKASALLKKVMKVKNDLEARKISLNVMKSGEASIESKIDDGASLGTITKQAEKSVMESSTDTTGDLAYDSEIKEDALDQVRNDIRERYAFNKKVKNENKIDLLEGINGILNDPQEANKVGAIEKFFKHHDDSIKVEAQKPQLTYTQKEKLKSLGSDQDAGYPRNSDPDVFLGLLTAIKQGSNLSDVATDILYAVEKEKLSKSDTKYLLSTGITTQNTIDRRKERGAKVLPRSKPIQSTAYKNISKTYFPFFGLTRQADPKGYQSFLTARLQVQYPGMEMEDIQKRPDYSLTNQKIAKEYALREIHNQIAPIVFQKEMSSSQLRVLTGNLGVVDISASTTEGIKKNYLELISKGINLKSFVEDVEVVDPEIEKIHQLYTKGKISDMEAITSYWAQYYSEQRDLYVSEEEKK